MYYDIVESGKRIQELRKAHGLKQTQLAERLNISLDHMKKIESGQRGCSVDLFVGISDYLDVSLDLLILGKERSNEDAQNTIQSLIEQMEALKKQL